MSREEKEKMLRELGSKLLDNIKIHIETPTTCGEQTLTPELFRELMDNIDNESYIFKPV